MAGDLYIPPSPPPRVYDVHAAWAISQGEGGAAVDAGLRVVDGMGPTGAPSPPIGGVVPLIFPGGLFGLPGSHFCVSYDLPSRLRRRSNGGSRIRRTLDGAGLVTETAGRGPRRLRAGPGCSTTSFDRRGKKKIPLRRRYPRYAGYLPWLLIQFQI